MFLRIVYLQLVWLILVSEEGLYSPRSKKIKIKLNFRPLGISNEDMGENRIEIVKEKYFIVLSNLCYEH